ncbi:MAG: signal recognition particle-docking protein FtsY, partial [Pseudomonadota bacterium]
MAKGLFSLFKKKQQQSEQQADEQAAPSEQEPKTPVTQADEQLPSAVDDCAQVTAEFAAQQPLPESEPEPEPESQAEPEPEP